MNVELREWTRRQVFADESARRAVHSRARLGRGDPGMPTELEQIERDRGPVRSITEAALRELGLLYTERPGYDQAWRP